MSRSVHVFENGVQVYEDHLMELQRRRYEIRNVHEAEEEDIFRQIIRELSADAVYVNIGAAIGYYPILARKISPGLEIHAVEPLGRHRDFMRENLTLNDLEQTDITIHGEAISASNGRVMLIDSGYGSSIYPRLTPQMPIRNLLKAVLFAVPYIGKNAGSISKERSITLDRLMQRIGSPVDFLQMDVQGFELDVLRGATESLASGQVQTFLIGTHKVWIHSSCVTLLQDFGYQIKVDEEEVAGQPDGIILASKGVPILAGKRHTS